MSFLTRSAFAAPFAFALASTSAFGQYPQTQTAPQPPAQQQPSAAPLQQPATLGAPIAVPQQQPVGAVTQQPQVAAPQQLVPQPPPGFPLNMQQQTYLDLVLNAWQAESAKVTTFRCDFERWEYNKAFGPTDTIPLNKDKGTLTFKKPDKGSFQISEIKKWKAAPAPAGPPPAPIKGDWFADPNAIGEHWVCDGKSIFEYREIQKQLVERPIPPQLQGQAIMDGPLPFLFGADAKKLNARYWIRPDDKWPNPNEVCLIALPKYQADAANYKQVRVALGRTQLLPTAMEVTLPDDSRHTYIFDIKNATINGTWDKLQSFFDRPRKPVGWTQVVEPIPVEQAAQPQPAPR